MRPASSNLKAGLRTIERTSNKFHPGCIDGPTLIMRVGKGDKMLGQEKLTRVRRDTGGLSAIVDETALLHLISQSGVLTMNGRFAHADVALTCANRYGISFAIKIFRASPTKKIGKDGDHLD